MRRTAVPWEAFVTRKGWLTAEEAGELLGMSARHFRRLRARYAEAGAEGLRDRRLGRVSGRRAPESELARMRRLYREEGTVNLIDCGQQQDDVGFPTSWQQEGDLPAVETTLSSASSRSIRLTTSRWLSGIRPPLRLPPEGVSALSGKDKGQGRAPRSVTSVRTFSSAAASVTSMTSTGNSVTGSTKSPTRASMPRPGKSWPSILPKNVPSSSHFRLGRFKPCCGSTAHQPRRHGLGRRQFLQRPEHRATASRRSAQYRPMRCAFSRKGALSPSMPSSMAAASDASSPGTEPCPPQPTAKHRVTAPRA